MAAMAKWDEEHQVPTTTVAPRTDSPPPVPLPAPIPVPVEVPAPPAIPVPRPRARVRTAAPAAAVTAIDAALPSASAPNPVRAPPKPKARQARKQVEVVIPPRKFEEIAADDSESAPEPAFLVYSPACNHCVKATVTRLCEREKTGGACLPCRKSKYRCEYANTRFAVDDDDVVEVVGKGGKRPAAGVGRTRVRKDTQVPKARASKRSRMEDVEQAEGEDDDDENVVEVMDVPAQGKGKKKATVGAARVKKEPDTAHKGKTAQRKVAEKSSG